MHVEGALVVRVRRGCSERPSGNRYNRYTRYTRVPLMIRFSNK
jgi:hypothetical protein